MAEQDLGKSSTGMQPNVAGLLCYLAGWITGLIFYLIEKENKFVRFHAMQSIIVSVQFVYCPGLFCPLDSIDGNCFSGQKNEDSYCRRYC